MCICVYISRRLCLISTTSELTLGGTCTRQIDAPDQTWLTQQKNIVEKG